MSDDAASIVNGDEKYEYGFHDDVKPVYSTGRGPKKLSGKFRQPNMSPNGC